MTKEYHQNKEGLEDQMTDKMQDLQHQLNFIEQEKKMLVEFEATLKERDQLLNQQELDMNASLQKLNQRKTQLYRSIDHLTAKIQGLNAQRARLDYREKELGLRE